VDEKKEKMKNLLFSGINGDKEDSDKEEEEAKKPTVQQTQAVT